MNTIIYLIVLAKLSFAFKNKNKNMLSSITTVNTTEFPDIIDLDSLEDENITSNYTKLDEKDSENKSYSVQYTFSEHATYGSTMEKTSTRLSHPRTTTTAEDLSWVNETIRDIGYYLRAYKFKEYDRRYNEKPPEILGQYFSEFPKPPLRSLHWEVNKYCDVSFYQCIKYLGSKIQNVVLRREDDPVYVSKIMNWSLTNNSKEIMAIDMDCKNLSRTAFWDAAPFEGPLERFQWRTTASYFMCWYSMKDEPSLMHFNESCDNFAECLSEEFGFSNNDPRANDSNPFSCALYSFCPDPCCPVKHIKDYKECFASNVNPCFVENKEAPTKQKCEVNRNENVDFKDIVLNRFNVSCHCQNPGYVWMSKYGICVDVDECALRRHTCAKDTEICVNTNGSFKCACNWGYIWNNTFGQCEPSGALNILKREKAYKMQIKETPEVTLSIVKLVLNLFSKSCAYDQKKALLFLFIFYFTNI